MNDDLGKNIRQRRRELGLSLDALCKKSGVSATMLSEVERGVKNPTVKLAYQIARALDWTLTELVGEKPMPQVQVTRDHELRHFVDPATGVIRSGQHSALLNKRLEIARYEIPPTKSIGEMGPNRSGLIEQVLVLEGSLIVVLGGEQHQLEAGDTVTYSVQSTDYQNPSKDSTCRFLLLSDASQLS